MTSRHSEPTEGDGPTTAREVQLCITLSPAGRAAIRAEASRWGLTVRALVLDALRAAGAPGLENEKGGDRRAAAALKSRLWHERVGVERGPDRAFDPHAAGRTME